MHSDVVPTTVQLLDAFTDEITARQGRVTDSANDGRRLLARSVLPYVEEVRPGDQIQGGVAIRATGGEVWVHPYLFRLVCKNGAIIARTVRTEHLADLGTLAPVDAVQAVREAVGACCEADVFADTFDRIQTAQDAAADLAVTLMPLLSRLSGGNDHLIAAIMDQFFREGDRSQFGLANAVTATAREIRDPDLRWELEEFGGGIAVGVVPPSPSQGPPAAARLSLAGWV